MRNMSTNMDDTVQAATWERLYHSVASVLRQFGVEDSHQSGDYWIHDSYWGFPQVKVFVHNLALLSPRVVKALQRVLRNFVGWEIMVAVAVRGEVWPDMGLTIRAHEIVDGLQRQYFPKEYRGFEYEGSRLGTDRD
jgi:hypothetical protein